ncbi:NAD(P)-binding protein [Jaminaea rosea]|uniref:NAD(P)-binding protein n=1 Tax=Jaminaea rosea TaxID=1569628 RepID=A0A316UJZ2_9BASI|nr:NAD(P)-binding protein [Jaminaea rosea]PWN25607.1 NAD(P)-binding protein [Jaminaea rosea]
MSASSSPLVLVTGITGFLSAHILDSLLSSPENFSIRGTLRSKSKSDALLSRFTPEQQKRIEFVEVKATESSDLTEAVKGVDYILHVASPFVVDVEDVQRDLLTPATEGTLNVLRYASKEKSVQFVGITSSFAAVTDMSKGGPNRPGFTYTDKDWNPAGNKEAIEFGGKGGFAYLASKKVAEEAAWDFVEKEKPSFTISAFNPPMIYGPPLQPGVKKANLNTSSQAIYGLISSLPSMPADQLPLFVHARDVADAHVRAISKHSRGAAGRRFLLCGGKFNWALAVHYIAERFPELKERLPKGWEESKPDEKALNEEIASIDTSPTEDVLGMQFKGWQKTLEETIQRLLELEKSEGWEK